MNPSRRRAGTTRATEPPHEVRIVGGAFKRSKLPVPDKPGLRPTPQRVRETLFNWLGQDLSGWACLDAFAGSGALGFEAASRGAASVVMLEREPDLVASLRASQQRLKADAVRVERAEAVSWMRTAAPGQFQLVLLDPPFDSPEVLPTAIEAATHLVAPAGALYVEAAQPLRDAPEGFAIWRQARAGAVWAQVLRRNS
ncbi:MAG TPA: 16S rRNA (guanine(966)-N(2))-methyltransferase RsmD [Burkholderiaceae bacterium]|nr:16S rRNA (guanine(966)-N(2))-methyltransferase RsmD [Burkholderiaceae bacterium]